MKHAGPSALDALEPLLAAIQHLDIFAERRRGIFYRKGHAALHFHEDPTGLYADLRLAKGEEFTRFRVSTDAERAALLTALIPTHKTAAF